MVQTKQTTPACGRRILLIEDNEDANESLSMLLTYEGHSVTSAFDGIAGLGLARTQVFDVLLCDIGLPGMDGLELITRLRSSSGLHIPFASPFPALPNRKTRNGRSAPVSAITSSSRWIWEVCWRWSPPTPSPASLRRRGAQVDA
ncbi:MAG: response regulator [Pseudomonadota bacterium]